MPAGRNGGQAGVEPASPPPVAGVDRDGVVRYGALGGIGPDVMAEGLKTILPGVNVTP